MKVILDFLLPLREPGSQVVNSYIKVLSASIRGSQRTNSSYGKLLAPIDVITPSRRAG